MQPVEPADQLGGEPPHLGDLAGHGENLGPHALFDRSAEPLWDCYLELGRGLGQCAEGALRALERGLQLDPAWPRLAGLGQARARPLQCFALHGR